MQGAGAELLVVALKVGNATGAKGQGQVATNTFQLFRRKTLKVAKSKPFTISKQLVQEAFKKVKSNRGKEGIDKQSIADFEKKLEDNLYKVWNRMSSGTYFPPPVKKVEIPKKSGGKRTLGIPTVADRVAQMVVKMTFEPKVEPIFLKDSYGYRPGKGALDAVAITKERCWKYNWVLEFDIKGLFDNIDHRFLMILVRRFVEHKWVELYVERWLKAPLQLEDGTIVQRDKGTPQGGVISPLLANLFLHHAFDKWMVDEFPENPWCRYADDGLVHCRSLTAAKKILKALKMQLARCKLMLNLDKTRIVYCRDARRKGKYPVKKFDFLGYTFNPRFVKNLKTGKKYLGFSPAVSQSALKVMRKEIRKSRIRNRSDLALEDIARWFNPKLRGWMQYFGKHCPSKLNALYGHFNWTLVKWARKKYLKLKTSLRRAIRFIKGISKKEPQLFAHWKLEKWVMIT